MLAMRDGRRPRDAALAAEIRWRRHDAGAVGGGAGRLTEARQSYEAIRDAYTGVVDVAEAERRGRCWRPILAM